jgi:GntR family transcriptional regulator/MocR family aminotransferase
MKPIVSELLLMLMGAPSSEPSYRRLYRHLRDAIHNGSIPPDSRLPSTRDLAASLGIARNTVTNVYEQLCAEGYTVGRHGRGTFTCKQAPDLQPRQILCATQHCNDPRHHRLSERGTKIMEAAPVPSEWGAFMPGVPDVTRFPYAAFARTFTRNPTPQMLAYAHDGGCPALREALARHLRMSRSVVCEPEQILITEGVHQAIDLIARMLGSPGDAAWVENPGYWGARSVFVANGIEVVDVPVDRDGMSLAAAPAGEQPRFIFVTPSHQYPLGTVMSFERRLQWIEFARDSGSWIIEDDYDSEFRFTGQPIPALQGLAQNAPVIYLGTFSKTMYPSLRLGYMVLPKALITAFRAGHTSLYREGHAITQAAVGRFITDGHYASHILRMRTLYGRRREVLASVIRRRLGPQGLSPEADNAGLHLILNLPEHVDDTHIAALARAQGILTRPLSRYYRPAQAARKGLLLGFACVSESVIPETFERLYGCLVAGTES